MSTPIQICADDLCQNCVAAPDASEGEIFWPSCAVHNVTGALENASGFGEVISGGKPAFFKIPEPEPGCKVVIRRPVPGVTVQNCGMITAVYSKATCAAQPRAGTEFMVQKCCGENCFDSRPQSPKRSVPGEEPEAGPESEATLELLGKKKRPKTYVHCGPHKECWKDAQCPADNRARPLRGIHADMHSSERARMAEEFDRRLEEQNDIGAKFGVGLDFGDLGLASLSPGFYHRLDAHEIKRRGAYFRACLQYQYNWLVYGHYSKPDDRTQVVRGWTDGGPDGSVAQVSTTQKAQWSTTLSNGRESLPFIRQVFEMVMYHASIPCGATHTRTETFEVPANQSGYLGFTPILDCTIAAHACGNWRGDAQIHEFCIPRLTSNEEADGVVGFIAAN